VKEREGAANAHVIANRQQRQHAVGRHWQTGTEQTAYFVDNDELASGSARQYVAAAAALDSSVMVAMQTRRRKAYGFGAKEVLKGLDIVLYEVHAHTGIVEGEEAVQGQLRPTTCFRNSA
jgi:hypothetical protein